MRRLLLFAIGMACSTVAATAAVPIKRATPELNGSTRAALLKAFSSPEALKAAKLTPRGPTIGPRLWAMSAEMRLRYGQDTKDVYTIVTSPGIVVQWKLQPFNPANATGELKLVLAEAAKEGTLVLTGNVFRKGDEVLAAIVLAQVSAAAFPFSVRRPTEAEISYYYSLIPFDLEEPVWVVESGSQAFFCHFDPEGHLFYFEEL